MHGTEEITIGQSHSLDAYALENTPDYITGALVRSRNTGLPLAYARRKKEFGPLPLSSD